MKYFYFIFTCFFVCSAFSDLSEELFVKPPHFPEPQYNFEANPLAKDKIELGRALFYDPILSRDNTISCSSCHSVYNSFAHTDHDLSHGIDDKIGTRNAPALINLAWQELFMWDGAVNHLDMQALAPISHPLEMDESIANICEKLKKIDLYPKLFYKAFSDSIITGERILKALAQFQLTLVSADSKYDSVMKKMAVFTEQESSGYSLFKKNCNTCHKEPLFSTYAFSNNGLKIDSTLNDYGRVKVSGISEDSLKFKIPTLRNIEFTPPYMHDGRFSTLNSVLNHYTDGLNYNSRLANELLEPIVLTAKEKVDLISFLLTLSDKKFIFNPQYSYPKKIFSR